MKRVRYNEEKDKLLREKRGVSFEDIIDIIQNEDYLAVIENPNKQKFPNQKMFVISFKDYVYVVPFVETDDEIFLKTIFPSRKYKKKYSKNL